MADQDIYGVAESGTYSTDAPNPHIQLSGDSPGSFSIEQLVSGGMSNGETATFTIRKNAGAWAVYSGVTYTTGTPNILDLSGASLLESAGSLASGDTVYCEGLPPQDYVRSADVGTVASQDADSVAITGGSVTGITDLAIADGGTASSTAAAARIAFGIDTGDATTLTSGVTITVPADSLVERYSVVIDTATAGQTVVLASSGDPTAPVGTSKLLAIQADGDTLEVLPADGWYVDGALTSLSLLDQQWGIVELTWLPGGQVMAVFRALWEALNPKNWILYPDDIEAEYTSTTGLTFSGWDYSLVGRQSKAIVFDKSGGAGAVGLTLPRMVSGYAGGTIRMTARVKVVAGSSLFLQFSRNATTQSVVNFDLTAISYNVVQASSVVSASITALADGYVLEVIISGCTSSHTPRIYVVDSASSARASATTAAGTIAINALEWVDIS